MADEPENQAPASEHAKADPQRPDSGPDGRALADDPPGKGRIHRPKLSLRYRSQTFAADL